MIELAKQRHPGRRFHDADNFEWKPPQGYDLISAWNGIWHMPLDAQEPVLMKILGALAAGGVCIFTTGGLDAPMENLMAEIIAVR